MGRRVFALTRRSLLLKLARPQPAPTDMRTVNHAIEKYNKFVEEFQAYVTSLDGGKMDLESWVRSQKARKLAASAWDGMR